MAKNRYVNTKFWSDNYILNNLNPTEKLVYIYFITNSYTDICGIYEIPLKIMALETGIDSDNLEKVIIPRFENDGKILYKNGWIAIKNFIKHQSINPKVKQGIKIGLKKSPKILSNFVRGIAYDSLSHSNSNSNSNSNLTISDLKKSPKIKNDIELLVDFFFTLKGWDDQPKEWYAEQGISYARNCKEAKELLALCDDNLEAAKGKLTKVADWAGKNGLEDWILGTAVKKFLEL